MDIIHIVESFGGGVYDFLVDLIKSLRDFNHIIIYGKRKDTPIYFYKDFPQNVTFIYWTKATREINPFKDFLALVELLKILRGIIKSNSIIHLHSSKAGFLGRLAAKILGISNKVIYTSHGAAFLRKDVSFLKQKTFEKLEVLAAKLGGKVIACSRSEAEAFKKIGINASYIYNGIDLTTCNQQKKRENLKRQIIIGTVGRITYQKNPFTFNEIAKRFEDNKKIKFLWIGDGELKEVLTAKNVKVTGWLSRKQVLNYIQEIDIYLSTSLWEGLPLSVLQAMCLKKPLVLSNCIGNIDLVKEGVNGFLFKNEEEAINKINFLIRNKELLEKFGENSFNILKENFDLGKTIAEYKKLYIEIAKGNI